MLKNLKLSHQGLILLLVPLVFEIAFASALIFQMHQFDALVREVNKSREFGASINNMLNSLYEAGNFTDQMMKSAEHPGPMNMAYVQGIKQRMEDVGGQCKTMLDTAPSPQVRANVEVLLRPMVKLHKMVQLGVDTYESGGALALYALMHGPDARGLSKFTLWQDELIRSMNSLLSARRAQEADYNEKIRAQETSFQRLKDIVIIGGALNIIVALLLWLNFSRGTAENFRVLIDNTVRLAQGNSLNPPIEGSGEIAHLDKVFKQMADALAQAAQYKKDLIAMVSHDLRTPLTSIHGYLTLLQTGIYGTLSEQGTQGLHIAEANATRLIALINDLLDIEKMESGKMQIELQNCSVDEVLQKSISSVIGFAQQQKVDLMADPSSLTVVADADRLVQVLVNLLSNAIKFSPAHSLVRLQAHELPDSIEFRVIDQGCGIPENFRSSIFERFQQVQSSDAKVKGGSGLGLAICKAIVEGHNGSIGVESEEGKGSTFWFRIPKQTVLLPATAKC